ncbi:formylglycine-generating enzyme family protein [Limnohabitans sp. Rim8]|uniref:formylglycine-generating enzyme family protein n=1 Tax=Limnohabitans sp. Rim8 TaxID=1100718 RepID=UPI0033061E4F
MPSAQTVVAATGQTVKDCDDCPEMVAIPAGSFEMGSTEFADEQPVHRVNVPAFLLGRTEVTQGQWVAVTGSNPSHFKQCGMDCPVEKISWIDAQTFAHKLSQKTGKTYRLPSEAEWEYAARAGSSGKWSFGDDASQLGQYAWFDANSNGKTHPVAKKKPNAFGLYDMQGNVYEWVQDVLWFNPNDYKGAPSDGSVWNKNCVQPDDELGRLILGAVAGCETELRGIRGGAWKTHNLYLRSANRAPGGTTTSRNTSATTGMRIARNL